jgi:hypothetical protein
MPHQHQMTAELKGCIQHCIECASVCEQTVTHCLMLGGKHASAEHIGLLMDCAQICGTSARFMQHLSHFHTRTCEVCAEVCDACAKDCEQMAGGDQTILECAKACRNCAESCHSMSRAMV